MDRVRMNTDSHAACTSGPALSDVLSCEVFGGSPEQYHSYDRRACTVCGHPDSPSVIDVWYDTLRDRVCGDCFAWATTKMKTVKLQRMYT